MMSSKLRVILAGVLISSAVGSSAGVAAPIEPLRPMAFLAGHCWKGQFADGKQTDEHCFAWLYDGKALRDTHTVRAPGRPDYVGETTYYWDSASKRVEFVYIENLGGVMQARTHRDVAYFDSSVRQLRAYFDLLEREAASGKPSSAKLPRKRPSSRGEK